MRNIAAVLVVLAQLTLSSATSRAAVPNQFAVQGVLRDGTGQLQSKMVTVSASLFDAATAGNKLAGPYGPTAVLATNGLFTFTITDLALQTKLAGPSQAWLELVVGSDTFARQLVTPQVYALLCGTADAVAGVVPIAHGGTGSATQSFVDLTTNQSIAGIKSFTSDVVVHGASSTFFTTDAGTAQHAPFTVDQTAVGGDAGILIKGNAVSSIYPVLTLSLQNSAARSIAGASLAGVITSTSAGAEAMDLAFNSKPTTGAVQERVRIASNGNVGIGTTTPGTLLQVGSATCNGTTWTNASSREYKSDIRPLVDPLGVLEKVQVYRYRYRPGRGDDRRERIGVIAEELPDEVSSLDHRGAPTGELVALSLASSRALVGRIARQAARIESLERRLDALAARR